MPTYFKAPIGPSPKGLYANVYDSATELDEAVTELAEYLLGTNPEAQTLLKGVFWEGYEHWDKLLEQRAEISGKLVLSSFTKEALTKFA